MIAAALIAALLAGAAAHGATTAPVDEEAPALSRNVDVTVICTTVSAFGAREIGVGASPRRVTSSFEFPAVLGVRTGSAGAPESIAGADARGHSGRKVGGIYLNRLRCSTTQARTPISPDGFRGPPIQWAKDVECGATRRVIVRLRATLLTPGPWQVFGARRELRGIRRNVRSAAVAVRTWPGRKPLALVILDASQQTRLWSAYGCT